MDGVKIVSKQPIRVLQILGIVAGGGVESVIMNYYKHIDRSIVQFDFIVHNDNKVDITDIVESMHGRVFKVTPYSKNPFAYILEIYNIIKQNNYNIIHSNMNTISAFSLLAAWLARAPIRILHNHSTSAPGEKKRNTLKLILRPFAKLFANRYFACSQLAAEWMYGKEAMKRGDVKIINNAIDLSSYAFNLKKREQLRQILGVDDRFVIGHVGRFVYAKNHEFLIEVFSKIHAMHHNVCLVLIGEGPLRKAIELKVKSLGLSDSVKFLGLRDDVQDLYNALDLFILPSYYEGLPVVSVEAQANALPILVSTNVTQEARLTSVIHYKSLSDGVDAWANEFTTFYNNHGDTRIDTVPMMRASGFDIIREAKKLQIYYLNIVNNKEA